MTSITSLTQNSGLAREASDSKKSPLLDLGTTEKFTDYLKPSEPNRKPQPKNSTSNSGSDRSVDNAQKLPIEKYSSKSRSAEQSTTPNGQPDDSTDKATIVKPEEPAAKDSTTTDSSDENTEVVVEEVAEPKEDENPAEQDLTDSIEALVAQLLVTPVCDCPVPVDIAKLVNQDQLDETASISDIPELNTESIQLAQAIEATTVSTYLPLETQATTATTLPPVVGLNDETSAEVDIASSSARLEISQNLTQGNNQLDELIQSDVPAETTFLHRGKIDLSSLPAALLAGNETEVASSDTTEEIGNAHVDRDAEAQLIDEVGADLPQFVSTVDSSLSLLDSTTSEADNEDVDSAISISADSAKSASQFSPAESPLLKDTNIATGHHHTQAQSHPHPSLAPADHQRFLTRASRAFELANARGGEIRIRLHPPELGSLRVEMKLEQGQMVAKVETESTAAKNLLVENLPQLKERLQELGVTIESFDVNVAQRDSRQDQQDAQEQAKRNRAAWNNQLPEAPSEPESSSPRLPWQRSEGLNIVI